ncbi:hypothetical protein NDN08_006053 [Rhodosorus marinus]|uniref:Serine/threonine-protein phosphatase 4 regulatory subunit 3-like central domain-containing protein n=1 Tax=Rhodosorus marinus TaxID=101924 RepID=A0AAV8UJL6_9RHOD|nr:hypothetical protein NDN08_006053 [Rhodosorus marinus]
MDEDDFLAELRADNVRLIDYLAQEETLQELITCSLEKPEIPEDADEDTKARLKFKYPHIASEVLSAEQAKITDGLVNNTSMMMRVFDLLDSEEGIDPIQAKNFAKVVVCLLRIKNAETMEAILQRRNFMIGILRNANAAPITDIIVRILDNPETERPFSTIVEPPSPEAVQLLAESEILEGLGNLCIATIQEGSSLSDEEEERLRYERIENSSLVMVDLTRRVLQLSQAHYTMPEDLNIFSNPGTIGRIMDTALNGDLSDPIVRIGLVHVLNVFIELLTTELNFCSPSRPKNEDEQQEMNSIIRAMTASRPRSTPVGSSPLPSPKSVSSTNREQLVSTFMLERELKNRIPRLLKILQGKSYIPPLETTTGVIEQPLGSLKLKLVELFVAALKMGGEDLQGAMSDLDVPNLLLDLFFTYEWGSILHQIISSAILTALDPEEFTNTFIQKTWLRTYLVKQLMATYKKYLGKKETDEHYRNGFLGHIVLITSKVEEFLSNFDYRPNKMEYLREDVLDEFELFCEEHLAAEKERTSKQLGGERPGGPTRSVSDSGNTNEEVISEVFGMEELMDGLTGGESNDAMKIFEAYLMKSSDAPDKDSDEDDIPDEGVDTVEGNRADHLEGLPAEDDEDSDNEEYEQFYRGSWGIWRGGAID